MLCDSQGQNILSQAEHAGKLSLHNPFDDSTREKLIKSILGVITLDTPSEKLCTDLELPTKFHSWKQAQGETVKKFANHFCPCIAKNTNYTQHLDANHDRQFASMMMRNA